ncbi:MAG: response regulator transcription factor [Bacteroidetes bacterium]|nr:response regulator transcription factor [Bacteroidota bacterium]
MNIIIADSIPIFRNGLEMMLMKISNDHHIMHASDGAEVMELLNNNPIDLIFMDINLPEENGISITKRIRESNNCVRIIGMSMDTKSNSLVSSFKRNTNEYMTKNADDDYIKSVFYKVMNYKTEGSLFHKVSTCHNLVAKQKINSLHDLREPLTAKEIEVLKLICLQLTSREISSNLMISVKTIEIHRARIMEKTHSKNMIGLVLYAIEKGFINR